MTQSGMIKLFSPSDWSDTPQQEDHQIKIASGGLGFSDKLASKEFVGEELLHWLGNMKTDADCVYVHKVAMGGSHRYGPNLWGDGFREEVLERDAPGFEMYAKAYRNHKSANAPFFGRPKLARFRRSLGVVELITEYYGTDKVASANGGKIADLEIQSLKQHGSIPVSMGSHVPGDSCFPAGTRVTTARGLVAIEDLRVGDEVVTHLGRLRRVKRTGQRLADERFVSIKPRTHKDAILSTWEHPYLVLKRGDVRHPAGRRRSDLSRVSPYWTDADKVESGDFVLMPVYAGLSDSCEQVELAKLFGYYAGNGSRIIQRTGKKKNGPHRLMGFAVSGNLHQPEICEEISQVIASLCRNRATKKLDVERSAYDLRTYDQRVAGRLVSECGDLCHTKRVPDYLFTAAVEDRLAFLGGLIDTDGSVDRKTGAIRIPLSNATLVEQCYLLASTAGLRGSISDSESESKWRDGTDLVTTLAFGASHWSDLQDYSYKVREWGVSKKPGGESFEYQYGGVRYIAVPVESVEHFDSEDVVYNLSVEEDESYLVEGVAVHNCVICNHWAPTRRSHCTPKTAGGTCDLFGCRTGMLKIAQDGRQQYVDNPVNHFYDISAVFRGADPVANGLALPIGMFDPSNDGAKVASFSDGLLRDIPSVGEGSPMTHMQKCAAQLAYIWSDMEAKIANGNLSGKEPGLFADYSDVDLQPLHSPSAAVRVRALRELASRNEFPDFAPYAKSAGYSDSQIQQLQQHVPQAYTSLIRHGHLNSLVRTLSLEPQRTNIKYASSPTGPRSLSRWSVQSRTLRANAENRDVERVSSSLEILPDVVAKYASAKLEWASHHDNLDGWLVSSLPWRDSFMRKSDDGTSALSEG